MNKAHSNVAAAEARTMRTVYFASLRGENLIPQDGKSCDPYVEIHIGDHTAKTEKIMTNHMDPNWSQLQGFSFPWDGVGAMPSVEFYVWDFDYIGFDDFIGFARMTLHRSMIGNEVKVRLGVRDDGDQKLLNQYGTLGNLYFTLAFADGTAALGNTGATAAAKATKAVASQQPNNRGGVAGDDLYSNGTPRSDLVNPVAQNNQRVLNYLQSMESNNGQKDLFLTNRVQRNPAVTNTCPEFFLNTITCEGIPVDDGVSVFVVMWFLEEEEWRTPPQQVQRGFAQWVNLQMDVGAAIGSAPLRFAVVRRDEQGMLRTVCTASNTPHPNTVNLESRLLCLPPNSQSFNQQTQASWGTLTYLLTSRLTSPGLASAAVNNNLNGMDVFSLAPPPGGMLIRVVEANDLLPLDYNEDPDPFVVAHWDRGRQGVEEIFRTQVLDSVCNPFWDEIHEIKQIAKHARKITFEVFDQDPHSLDFAGTCDFDFLNCDPMGSYTFALYSRADDPEVTAKDDGVLRRFGRDDFGTLTIEWNIDPEVLAKAKELAGQQFHVGSGGVSTMTQQQQQQQGGYYVQQPQHQQGAVTTAAPLAGGGQRPILRKGTPPVSQTPDNLAYAEYQQQQLHHGPQPVTQYTQAGGNSGGGYQPPQVFSRGGGNNDYYNNNNNNNNSNDINRDYYTQAPITPAEGARRSPQPSRRPQQQLNGSQQQQQQQQRRPHQQQQQQQSRSAAMQLNGGILSVTLLSVANITTTQPIAPYARITYQSESKDNCIDNIQPATEAVWNFKSEFYVQSIGAGVRSGSPPQQQQQQRGVVSSMPQQQRQQQKFLIELCDARSHGVLAIATVDVPNAPQRTKTCVVPMYAPVMRPPEIQTAGNRSPQGPRSNNAHQQQQQQTRVIAELSFMLTLTAVTLPRDIPLTTSAMLDITVIGARNLNTSRKPNLHLHTNPYATITVISKELGKTEYRSDTVWNSKSPKWFFSIPQRAVSPSDSVVVAVWDHDQDDFDEFLGQARFSVGTLVQSPAIIELPLEGRVDAKQQHDVFNNSRDGFGTVSVEWSVTQRSVANDAINTAPHIAEIAVIDASHLARSRNETALVQLSVDERGSLSEQPFTKVVPKGDAAWNETFKVQMVGVDTQIRFTVWDETGSNATFLGEAVLRTASLKIAQEHSESVVLQLRPRQDARYSREDLALLNQSPSGFGTLRVEARIFSMQEYERRTREAMRRQGKRYQLILQVAGTADIGPHGSYFVAVQAGNEERTSQVETGFNVRFKNNFTFELHNSTEMVVLSLYQRGDTQRGDALVGDVSFPVKPPSPYENRPDEAWLTLRDHLGQASQKPGGQAPRLFVRWRTFPDNRPLDAVSGPFSPTAPMPNSVDDLQRELKKAREEILALHTSGPTLASGGPGAEHTPLLLQSNFGAGGRSRSPVGGRTSSPTRKSRPFNYSIYVPQTAQVMTYCGTEDSTVSEVLRYCIQQLELFQAATVYPYRGVQLVYLNEALKHDEKLSRYVTEKDVVLLQVDANLLAANKSNGGMLGSIGSNSNAFSGPPPPPGVVYSSSGSPANRNAFASARPMNSYGPSLNNSRDMVTTPNRSRDAAVVSSANEYQNNRVLQRLQSGESARHDIVSVFLSTYEPLQSTSVSWLVDMCSRHRVSGFCRQDNLTPVVEFFVQGDPRDVCVLLSDIFAHCPLTDLKVEEAFGFIPRVGAGFRCSRTPTDVSTMFMHCAERLSPESTDVWFVHIPPIRDNVGTRYVNERGE